MLKGYAFTKWLTMILIAVLVCTVVGLSSCIAVVAPTVEPDEMQSQVILSDSFILDSPYDPDALYERYPEILQASEKGYDAVQGYPTTEYGFYVKKVFFDTNDQAEVLVKSDWPVFTTTGPGDICLVSGIFISLMNEKRSRPFESYDYQRTADNKWESRLSAIFVPRTDDPEFGGQAFYWLCFTNYTGSSTRCEYSVSLINPKP
jgi:hypothetical protein